MATKPTVVNWVAAVLIGMTTAFAGNDRPAPAAAVNPFQKMAQSDHAALREYIGRPGAVKVIQQHSGYSLLHMAVRLDDAEAARLLLEAAAAIDTRDRLGRTPLHLAAANGSQVMAEMLLRAGAQVNVRDRDGLTPLHTAIRHRQTPMVTVLAEWGADTGARTTDHGLTPLHWAAMIGCPHAVNALLAYGADIHAVDNHGRTSYQWARHYKTPAARMLARHGAHWHPYR